MELQTSNRFEVLGANVEMHRSQKEVSHGRDPAKKQDAWCTRVTKQRSLRFRDTQLMQTVHLQFPRNRDGEEMVSQRMSRKPRLKLDWETLRSIPCGNTSWSLGFHVLECQRWFEWTPTVVSGARHSDMVWNDTVSKNTSPMVTLRGNMVTERMVGILAKMAERGVSEKVNELLNWASFTHGQNYEMHGFCWDEIHSPLADQPNLGERGRTEPGSCSGQENRNDERCSNRVVQSDPDSLHELHLPGWSNITNGLLEHVAGTGGATKESEHA